MATLHGKLPVSQSSVEPTGNTPSTPTSDSMGPSVCTHAIPVQTPSTPAALCITLRPWWGPIWDFWVKSVKIPIFGTGHEPQLWPGVTSRQT